MSGHGNGNGDKGDIDTRIREAFQLAARTALERKGAVPPKCNCPRQVTGVQIVLLKQHVMGSEKAISALALAGCTNCGLSNVYTLPELVGHQEFIRIMKGDI